jgi:hypothetical protein
MSSEPKMTVTPLHALAAMADVDITPIEEIAVVVANLRTNVHQMLAPFQETISVAAGMAKMVNDFQASMHQTVERWLAEQQLSWMRTAEMKAIAIDGFEQYRNQEEPEACKILSDAGWLEMDRHFCLQHLREMVVLYKARGESAMSAAIVNHFNCKNCTLLVEMSDRWMSVPYLRQRENIIRDAVEAHKQRKFTLSIPALLPLVDGLSAEVLENQSMKAVALLANDRRAKDPEIWVRGFCDFVAHVYYKGYRFGKDTAPSLSRHGILHGRVSDYPSVLNSTRVFLFLDVIADIWLEKQRAISPAIQ